MLLENWFQPCTHTSHDSRDTRIILNFTPLFSKKYNKSHNNNIINNNNNNNNNKPFALA